LDSDSDEEAFSPKKKRAKPAAKKASMPKPPRPSNALSTPKSKKKAPTLESESPKNGLELSEKTSQATTSAIAAGGDSLAQYQGIPLEELRNHLTPQEYVKLSIMRSIAESAQGGSEKNVTKLLHPDLAPTLQFLNWESELRAMVATWVDLLIVTQSCLELLEAEATRYTRNLLKALESIAKEHLRKGTVNKRVQKPMMYSNQAQRIDLKLAKPTDVEKVLDSAKAPSVPGTSSSASASQPTNPNGQPNSTLSSAAGDSEDDFEYDQDRAMADSEDDESPPKSRPTTSQGKNSATGRATPVPPPGFDRIPIMTVDHIAEMLVLRDVSLVRRLEYLVKRLAEDDKAQRMSKETETEKPTLSDTAEHSGPDSDSDDEDDQLQEMIWTPSLELEEWMRSKVPNETSEKHHLMHEDLISERMLRVEAMPAARLDDWQNQSSVSFARPKLSKFKSWLFQCCHWDTGALCLPSPLLNLINFLTYEHLRYIVRGSVTSASPATSTSSATSTIPISSSKPPLTLKAENLRAEIEARHLAGDAVRIEPLAAHPS
jgi:hypothetical protein